MNQWIYAIAIWLFPMSLMAGAAPKKAPTVCLNMIVKNESQVIERCLASVVRLIDYWVIDDTGSGDGTQEIIKKFMLEHDIPGELYERPWVNFAHNRNEAMEQAKGKADYLLFIDADEHFAYESDFELPYLDKDYYHISVSHAETNYCRIHLINNHKDWKWIGVVHELIVPPADRTCDTLRKVTNIYTTEGARSKDPEKYLKDAKLLETALELEPDNARNIFYLAQSYKDYGDKEKALLNYSKRAEMGGWDQEVFWSLLQVAILQEHLDYPKEAVIASYRKAYESRMSRIEPLYHLARIYREKKEFYKGYEIAKLATAIPPSKDLLFVQTWMYAYGLPLERSVCAYWIGNYKECQTISSALLEKTLPDGIRDVVQANLGFANAKLLESICK
jgi:glycosyltransferase involved in cell wall biosynthesis